MSHFIHIGLGKVASSSLQNIVFPIIKILRPKILYVAPGHNVEILDLIKKFLENDSTDGENKTLTSIIRNNDILLSWEGINSWDPRHWEEASEKILELFDKNATILIMVRNTMSYYRSIYQQVVATGDVLLPQEFFVSKFGYDENIYENNHKRIRAFDVDSYSIENLFDIYSNKFRKVYMVPLDQLASFYYLSDYYKLNRIELTYLTDNYCQSKHINKSFSLLAMRLTLFRRQVLHILFIKRNGVIKEKYLIKYTKLNTMQKLYQIPYRILRKIRFWDRLMRIVTKAFPYKKYKLPNNIYYNTTQIYKNDKFIRNLADS